MIRDTSGQDRPIETRGNRFPVRIVGGVIGALALVMLSAWLFSGWRSSAVAANASRLRIAEVTQGTLLRDASVNGRVVAAVSPTLYAPAGATVSLKVKAGDTVKKNQILAQLESPDLASALRREQSTYEELKSEISRQEVLAQKAKLKAVSDADQAEIERAAAQRRDRGRRRRRQLHHLVRLDARTFAKQRRDGGRGGDRQRRRREVTADRRDRRQRQDGIAQPVRRTHHQATDRRGIDAGHSARSGSSAAAAGNMPGTAGVAASVSRQRRCIHSQRCG